MATRAEVLLAIKAKDEASRVMQGITGQAKKMGGVMGTALKAGALAGGAAVAGIGIAAVKMAADFDKGMREVNTLINLSEKEFEGLKQETLALSKEMGIASGEAVPALYQAISAGVPRENVMEFLQIASKAAIGGVTDLGTAVDGLTSVVNAYGPSVIDASRAGDIMFTGVKLGKTTFEELSASLFNVVPIAAASGVAFEEITAALAALTTQGVPTTVAATQLRAAIQALSAPTIRQKKLMNELGLEFSAARLQEIGLSAAMKEAIAATGGNMEQLRKLIGSVEGLQAVLALGGEQAYKFDDALEAMTENAGSVEQAFEEMNKSFTRQVDLIKTQLNVAMIELGEKILPHLSRFMETTLMPAVQRFSTWLGQDFPYVATVARDAAVLLIDGLKEIGGLFADLIDVVNGLPAPVYAAAAALGVLGLLGAVNPLVAALAGTFGLIFALQLVRTESEKLPIPLLELKIMFLEVAKAINEAVLQMATLGTVNIPGVRQAWEKLHPIANAQIDAAKGYNEEIASTRARLEELQGALNSVNTRTMRGELEAGMQTMASFGARLEEIQYAAYIGITPPSVRRPEVPNLDPWARAYLAEQRRALAGAGDGAGAGGAPPPLGGGGGGAAAVEAAEEMGRELGAALSEAFAEELALGMENVPQVFRDLAENAGNAIEAFSASFREQLIPVVVQVNDLARLGPDVPQSYRDAEAAIQEYRLGVWEAGVALVQARDEQRAAAWEVLQAENAYDFAAEAVGRYEDALANARDELRTWTNAQLEGTNAFNDAMFEIEQAIREKRLELLMAEMAGAAEEELGRIRAELDRLRQEAERLDLEHQINVAPALHDIEQLTRVSEEFSADEITGGIGDAQRAIDDIEPRLEDANELLDTQQTRLDDAGDAYDRSKKKVADAESVYETMVDVLGVLEKALRDETRSALDQFAWLEFGANAAKFTFRLFEDHVHQRLQPTLNSINTDNAQREINELTDAFWRLIAAQLEANNLGVATAGVQSFQGGGIVPGPQGAGRLVLAHGGEYIGPPGGRAGGGGSWRNYGTVVANFPNAHDAGTVIRELDRYFRGN